MIELVQPLFLVLNSVSEILDDGWLCRRILLLDLKFVMWELGDDVISVRLTVGDASNKRHMSSKLLSLMKVQRVDMNLTSQGSEGEYGRRRARI